MFMARYIPFLELFYVLAYLPIVLDFTGYAEQGLFWLTLLGVAREVKNRNLVSRTQEFL